MNDKGSQLNTSNKEGTVADVAARQSSTTGRKPYIKPAIIHEQEVEASVGSPLGLPVDPAAPLGIMGTRR